MRWLALYLRCRSIPVATAALLGTTAALGWLSHIVDNPAGRNPLALLAVLAGIAAIGPGLAGADIDLDRVAAIAWAPRRAVHLVGAGAVLLGALAATALTGRSMAPAGQLVRDVAGLGGLVALGAVTLGAARAWLLPFGWALVVVWFTPPMGTPPVGPTANVMLTWMIQPATAGAATVAAAILGTAGALGYAVLGSRRSNHAG